MSITRRGFARNATAAALGGLGYSFAAQSGSSGHGFYAELVKANDDAIPAILQDVLEGSQGSRLNLRRVGGQIGAGRGSPGEAR